MYALFKIFSVRKVVFCEPLLPKEETRVHVRRRRRWRCTLLRFASESLYTVFCAYYVCINILLYTPNLLLEVIRPHPPA